MPDPRAWTSVYNLSDLNQQLREDQRRREAKQLRRAFGKAFGPSAFGSAKLPTSSQDAAMSQFTMGYSAMDDSAMDHSPMNDFAMINSVMMEKIGFTSRSYALPSAFMPSTLRAHAIDIANGGQREHALSLSMPISI
jgi:hypothetical protein